MIAVPKILARSLAIVILLWGGAAIAFPVHSHPSITASFASIPQPLWLKIAITLGGMSLIGAELAWFFGNKSKNSSDIPPSSSENQ